MKYLWQVQNIRNKIKYIFGYKTKLNFMEVIMTDIERNILLNQYVIMSALETLITRKTCDYDDESRQLKDRMEDIYKILNPYE